MRTMLIIAIALFAACGSDSTAEQLCNRLDSCGFIDEGESVDSCTKAVEGDLDQIPDAQRAEIEDQVQECVDRNTCEEFLTCLASARTAATATTLRSEPDAPLATE